MQIGEKGYDKVRLRHLINVLLSLRENLPTSRRNSFDEEYLKSRAGIIPMVEDEIFQDVLEYLISGGFYYRTVRDNQLYVL